MTDEREESISGELESLKKKLEVISHELSNAGHIDNVFWQIQAIIGSNPEINHNDVFQEWIALTYIDSITIRLRRLVDKRRGSISLWRFLNEMKNISTYFSRERHIKSHEQDMKSLANIWFDDLAGENESFITKAKIEGKKNELEIAFNRIDSYVNSQIAHLNDKIEENKVTFSEVRNTIVSFFNVFNWCQRLLNFEVSHSPVPQPTSNWLKYFRVPWIKPDDDVPIYKHLNEYVKEVGKSK
jgi:hypothetical protein